MTDINININVYVQSVLPTEHVTCDINIEKPEKSPEQIFSEKIDRALNETDENGKRVYWVVCSGHNRNGLTYYVLTKQVQEDFERISDRFLNIDELKSFSLFTAFRDYKGNIKIIKDREWL